MSNKTNLGFGLPNAIAIGVGVIASLILITSCFVIVDSGRVGVVRRLGAVQPDH